MNTTAPELIKHVKSLVTLLGGDSPVDEQKLSDRLQRIVESPGALVNLLICTKAVQAVFTESLGQAVDMLVHTPDPSPGSGLYRTVFIVELLTDRPASDMDIEDVAYEMTEGQASGRFDVLDHREISREDMHNALEVQGSDPSFFLLGDEDDDEETE